MNERMNEAMRVAKGTSFPNPPSAGVCKVAVCPLFACCHSWFYFFPIQVCLRVCMCVQYVCGLICS